MSLKKTEAAFIWRTSTF